MKKPIKETLLIALFTCIAMLCATSAESSPSKLCNEQLLRRATSELKQVKNWPQLHHYFDAYSSCDDGGLADDVTEFVTHQLSYHWDSVVVLNIEGQKDARFLNFILSHIDSTADTINLKKIQMLSLRQCGPNLKSICIRLNRSATKALAEV